MLRAAALEESNLQSGQFALLAALRHIAEAPGMANGAEKPDLRVRAFIKT